MNTPGHDGVGSGELAECRDIGYGSVSCPGLGKRLLTPFCACWSPRPDSSSSVGVTAIYGVAV
jgi:hypothetical protein